MPTPRPRPLALAAACCLATLAGVRAPSAQPATPSAQPAVAIELNALDPVEGGCQVSFVVRNGHDADIDAAVYEAVLFDATGRVDRLSLFDFGALPAGRPRVRQFILDGLACDGVSQVLINGAATCTAPALSGRACTDGLVLSSRATAALSG